METMLEKTNLAPPFVVQEKELVDVIRAVCGFYFGILFMRNKGRIIKFNSHQHPSIWAMLSTFLGFLSSVLRESIPAPSHAGLFRLLRGAVLIELLPEDCVRWVNGVVEP